MSNRTVWSSLEYELVGLFATWLWRVRRRAKAKEAKKMAQSGKGLQVWKHGDLSSISRTHAKESGMIVHACNPGGSPANETSLCGKLQSMRDSD